ncbi:MAG: TerB family tellurite resistance protein [Bacteroidota bacterium]
MLDLIKQFFGTSMAVVEDSQREENIEDRLPLATCALLLEMAHADQEFSEVEKNTIISLLAAQFHLSDEVVNDLMRVAEKERRESTDLWGFTHLIDARYSEKQKVKVVEILWRVVYSDGKVDMHEEYLVRKLSYLLGLKHEQLIEAKLRAMGKA